jgi:hypothetical protein
MTVIKTKTINKKKHMSKKTEKYMAAVFGTHGNQGFATVAYIRDLEKFKNEIMDAVQNMNRNLVDDQCQETNTLLGPGRFVCCNGWTESEAVEVEETRINLDGFKGMYSGGRVTIFKVKRLPKKALF